MLSRIFSPSPATATLSAADSVPTGRWLTWSVCWGAEETAHTLCFWSWMVCLLFSVVLNFFQNSKKNPKQTVASATCARERGVKEVRCVCCAVFCSNSSSSSCGRVCLPLSLSLHPLNTTDRDLEDTGRGIKLPIIVDFLSCLPHMGETGNVKFRPKSVVS